MNSFISHIITFSSGLLVGIFSGYIANRLSEKAKGRDKRKELMKDYNQVKLKLPELIAEMKLDLKNPELKTCREFHILPNKNVLFNLSGPQIRYYENEHNNLISKIRILESYGFVKDITVTKTPKYQFNEKFVDILLNDK